MTLFASGTLVHSPLAGTGVLVRYEGDEVVLRRDNPTREVRVSAWGLTEREAPTPPCPRCGLRSCRDSLHSWSRTGEDSSG